MAKRWFVAQAVRNREIAAAMFATQRGFEAHVPLIQRQRLIGRQIATETAPRFGTYIFLRFDREVSGWQALCRHARTHRDYFERILCNADNKPSPVPDLAMEAIRAYSQPEEREITMPHVYRTGDPVMCYVAGIRLQAVFLEYQGNNRKFVRTWIFGRETTVEVTAAELEPLDNPQDLATGCAT